MDKTHGYHRLSLLAFLWGAVFYKSGDVNLRNYINSHPLRPISRFSRRTVVKFWSRTLSGGSRSFWRDFGSSERLPYNSGVRVRLVIETFLRWSASVNPKLYGSECVCVHLTFVTFTLRSRKSTAQKNHKVSKLLFTYIWEGAIIKQQWQEEW